MSVRLLPEISGDVSIALYITVINATVGITSTSLGLFFSSNRIKKKFLITKRKKAPQFFLLARSKLSSIENGAFKALIDNPINHEDFLITINEAEKYCKLKKNKRMMKSERGDTE